MKASTQQQLNAFLLIYFLELEIFLNANTDELKEIKFQSEEANTDEYIKKHFKELILSRKDISESLIKKISMEGLAKPQEFEVKNLPDFKITAVYIPEELSAEHRARIAKRKKSVYTNPDLYIKIEAGAEVFYESLEIKSTKVNNIPGASVQQIAPYEWVIFVKRGAHKIEVTTGHYINSITDKIPFPDRSPRPQIGFNTLQVWNHNHRTVENGVLTIKDNPEIISHKLQLLDNWQEYLATEWMAMIKADGLSNNEKWFNNTLRIFAVKFLEYSNELSEVEKVKLLERLRGLVKK